MNQAYRNSHGNTNEEQICPQADGHETLIITELVVEAVRDCASEPEGKSHPRRSNTERYSPVPDQKPQVHLESHEEEEEDQTDIGRRGECRHGGCWEDGIGEAWGTAEDRGTEEDAADDLCDDPWLSDLGEREVEESGEYQDDASLQRRWVSMESAGRSLERHTWMMNT